MKDYRLSEIKAICEKHDKCEDCEFSVERIRPRDGKIVYDCSMILDSQPYNWQIDKEEKQTVNPANLENEKVFKRNKEKSGGTGLNIC